MNIDPDAAFAVGGPILAIGAVLLLIEFAVKGGQAGIRTPLFHLSGSPRFIAGLVLVGGGVVIIVGPNLPASIIDGPFSTDEGELTEPMVAVPDVRRQQEADGLSNLRSLGFEVDVQRSCSPRLESGHILAVHAGQYDTDVLPNDDELTGRTISTEQGLTIFVSDGVCSEPHCSMVRPFRTETVRFDTGAEDDEVQVTLSPGEAVAYSLNVRAGQMIEVTATSGQAGSEHLLCVFDTQDHPIAAGSSFRVTSPPLGASGDHRILIQERSGVATDYNLRFFVPAH